MMKSESESYKAAGVDITAGYASVELMKKHVARTMTAGCVEGIGGFGGPVCAGRGGHGRAGARFRHGWRRHEAENRHAAEQA